MAPNITPNITPEADPARELALDPGVPFMAPMPGNTNSAVEQIAQQAFFARTGILRQAGGPK